jgi:hypothetical protein
MAPLAAGPCPPLAADTAHTVSDRSTRAQEHSISLAVGLPVFRIGHAFARKDVMLKTGTKHAHAQVVIRPTYSTHLARVLPE